MKTAITALLVIALTGCATVTRTDQFGNVTTSTEFDHGAAAAFAIGFGAAAAASTYYAPRPIYYAPQPQPVIIIQQPTYIAPSRGFILPRPY